jgi:DNA gyrase inhibitor GyrI
MNLTLDPQIVTWPQTHYVFIERVGPFMQNAPQAWQAAHALAPALSEHNQITGYLSLYRMEPDVYRAGFAIAQEPKNLPEGLSYEKFHGGKYSRFVLTGPYTQLPEASGKVWGTVAEKKIPLRDDFAIENYLNDPRTTPEAELLTEILVPTE